MLALSTVKGKLKIIRSDNALEFTDKACTTYFSKKGIVHHIIMLIYNAHIK